MANHLSTDSTVKIGSALVGELKSFTVTQTAGTIEDTVLGDTAKTFKAGLTSWSGSADANWDETDAGQTAISVGSEVVFSAYFEGVASGDTYQTGSAIVSEVTTSTTVDGLVEASFSFTGTGALTTTTV
jgi:hypothetical protein